MHPRPARQLAAFACLVVMSASAALHSAAAQAETLHAYPGSGTAQVASVAAQEELLDAPAHGRAAVEALGAELAAAAELNDTGPRELRELLLTDRTAWISTDGRIFYKEPALGEAAAVEAGQADSAAYPYDQTFRLHSKPGSLRTLHLDFDGATVTGTWWNERYPTLGTTHPAWTLDADASTFSTVERDAIQLAWQIVAEDYAPFGVDVTTEDPGRTALERTSLDDLRFGSRALISPSTSAQNAICGGGCGGVASLGTFDRVGSADAQPAWVFPQSLGNDAKAIAEAASHEVGHNLGLKHDGRGGSEYYDGHAAWAPIMGAGYYRPVSQWSIGDYPEATNAQNDLVVIRDHGLPLVADDHAATTGAATGLGAGTVVEVPGVVSTRRDVDLFVAELTCAGTVTATARPDPLAPNLDIRLRLLDATGAQVAAADPPSAYVGRGTASGLSAQLAPSVAAGTYYLEVDGVGAGDPAALGYTDFGSLGAYTLEVSGCLGANVVAPLPSEPVNLVPSAGVQQAMVSWQAPANAVAAGVSAYRVQLFSGSGATPVQTSTVPVGTVSKTFTALTAGNRYSFDVAAIGASGVGAVSARSAQVTPTAPPLVRPGKVQIGQASAGAIGGSITATARWTRWTTSAVTGYRVTALRLDASGRVRSRTVSAMQPPRRSALSMVLPRKGTYAFVVRAFNRTVTGPVSARSNRVAGR